MSPADATPTILLSVFVLPAVLSFGAVHPWIRGGIGSIAAVVALYILVRPRHRSGPPTALIFLWFLALTAVGCGLVALLPAGPGLRNALLPGYADVLTRVGHVAGWEVRPLALHPRGALFASAFGVHMLLVAAATAVVVTSSRRAVRVGTVLVATGLGIVALDLAQRIGGATSVGWISGIGEGRPFFGTFVNPNHGGVFCAVSALLALALAFERRRYRWMYLVAAASLAAGTLLSGSRGASVVVGAGSLVFLLLDGRRAFVRLALGGCAVVTVALASIGPEAIFSALSAVVDPSMPKGADLYSDRPQLWQDASGLVSFAPVLGVGSDGFLDAYKFVKVSPRFALSSQAHSDPFQIAVEHGFPALFLWASAAIFLLGSGTRACVVGEPGKRGVLAGYMAALSALFVFALFDFPMRIGALLLVGAILAGVILGLSYSDRPQAPRWARMLASTTAVLAGAVGFGCLAVAATARDSAFGDYQVSLEGGVEALSNRDYEEVKRLVSASLLQRPMNQRALLLLAKLQMAQGQRDRARTSMKLAAEVHPTYPYTGLSLAHVHRKNGDRDAALDAYRHLIALNHPTEQPKLWLDEAFSYAGDFENLVGYLLRDRADRWCPAAQWLERSGDRKDAELLYRLGAERSDGCAAQLGWRFAAWGRSKEALAWIEPLPSSCLTERTRGYVLLKLGRDREGLEAYELAVRRCKAGERTARVGLARACIAVGDQRAIALLERLLEDRDEPAIRHLLFRAYRDAGRAEKAADQVMTLSKSGFARDIELEWLSLYSIGYMK